MTYGLVVAILVLALIGVFVAIVFSTDEDRDPERAGTETLSGHSESPGPGERSGVTALEGEKTDSAERIVDVPEEADRDAGTVRV
jgi:hypothetical protein